MSTKAPDLPRKGYTICLVTEDRSHTSCTAAKSAQTDDCSVTVSHHGSSSTAKTGTENAMGIPLGLFRCLEGEGCEQYQQRLLGSDTEGLPLHTHDPEFRERSRTIIDQLNELHKNSHRSHSTEEHCRAWAGSNEGAVKLINSLPSMQEKPFVCIRTERVYQNMLDDQFDAHVHDQPVFHPAKQDGGGRKILERLRNAIGR